MGQRQILQNTLAKHLFTRAQVVEATGISPETLATWTKRGFITPDVRSPGTGATHYFNLQNVYEIAIAKALTIGNIKPRSACEAAGYVRRLFRSPSAAGFVSRDKLKYFVVPYHFNSRVRHFFAEPEFQYGRSILLKDKHTFGFFVNLQKELDFVDQVLLRIIERSGQMGNSKL